MQCEWCHTPKRAYWSFKHFTIYHDGGYHTRLICARCKMKLARNFRRECFTRLKAV